MTAAEVFYISARPECLKPGCATPLIHSGSPLAIVILVICAALFFAAMLSNNRTYSHWRENEGASSDPESGPPPSPPKYRGTRGTLPLYGPLLTLFVVAGALVRGNFGISALPMFGALALALAGASVYAYSKSHSRSG
jgi:hypothetical protein